ncbi:Sodium- and chloride-dependent neutral and basic amino acid transporter B(0+),Sodium-dependent proline transporter,Sodium- and chloride-dependent glycine transporter 1,Sodium-dependent dopamine transporter,Sodium-and chloride-dependent glycine transporter 2,Sodium-dependent neutral amino acid transporter B(0)AT2,Sodium- and chloride-dependent transporter XTRP3B [Mytilus coruscus]|uniref:Transporter n=1 Tax=Mytilus coruscus TaxID=42192 RepID=A0A6J8BGQ9_MYTCO|nr:Sodium- and chloride-dependent neutral and basic amino acid transporter B(0+),Sodium-dependent proline transporter,Sodium- and chloride-dependent glycine transporter 1,Sodium-dependent dopamine transporter,Sodium-and chloride-dependent glycine transporter 2,Sodium-dependent neutral amino acid transporter B(0)AT2,Sodium- and chloride-dependent transporter XTRP3B [Mytilus coruscus]
MQLITSKDSCILGEKSANYIGIEEIACDIDFQVLSSDMGIKEVTFDHIFASGTELTEGAVSNQFTEKEGGACIGEDFIDKKLKEEDESGANFGKLPSYEESQASQMEANCIGDSIELDDDSMIEIPSTVDRGENPETASARLDEHIGWDRKIEYLLACCGFVTSFETIVKFPYLSLQYGGGVFFVVYLVLMLVFGFPLLYLEMILGQYARGGPITAWGVVPLMKGIGVCMVCVSGAMSFCCNMTTVWSFYMFFISICSDQSWNCTYQGCSHNTSIHLVNSTDITNPSLQHSTYFYNSVLNISNGIESLGDVQWRSLLVLILCWTLVYFVIIRGPQSIGKTVYISFPIPMTFLITILVRTCFEEGAVTGIKVFLNLNWEALGNLQIWVDAGQLMVTSLGIGTGCITLMSGYSHFHSHCFRNALLTTLAHLNALLTTLAHLFGMVFAGFTLFSLVGVYNEKTGQKLSDTLNITAIDIGFVIVPSVLYGFTSPKLWLGLLFISLALVGLDTHAVHLQNIVSALLHLLPEKYRFRWKFKYIMAGSVCLLISLLSIVNVTQAGLYISFYWLNSVTKFSLFFITLCECMLLAWIYGAQRVWNNIADMTGSTDSPWWKITWQFLTPSVILALIILTVMTDSVLQYKLYEYPSLTKDLSWCITFIPLLTLFYAAVLCYRNDFSSFRQKYKDMTKTPTDWGPGPLGNQEPGTEPPDYVICTPDIFRPETGLALLTANLYIPNLKGLIDLEETQGSDDSSGPYLSDMMTVDSGDTESTDDSGNSHRGNWSSRLDFVLSCLGYVVGLGNVWRFPYLVYRNGGGAFFIPYIIMLVTCGIPLVYMELAFGQYASLGPVTVWRAVPLFKGIGMAMVLSSFVVSIYYNMVNAWAVHYLFSSMTATLPWFNCGNDWNNPNRCSKNIFEVSNCSHINSSYVYQNQFQNHSCFPVLANCSLYSQNETKLVTNCITELRREFGAVVLTTDRHTKLTTPSEEYFYNRVLNVSGSLANVGGIQWELALCLLLCWVVVFVCLVRGIRTSGKIAYFVVTFPMVIMMVLLVRALMMEGNIKGIKFYVTPKWEKLKEPKVWADAAVQVFFSLSACMGGLTTLASYNKFHNNIYSDAILVCLGDTLVSVLAGFSMFAMLGVLSHELGADIENVIQSDIGLTFIVNPEAMSYFPISPLWSILFFLMIVMLGISTQFVNVETVITAIIDENITLFRRRRIAVLFVVCSTLFLLGLPLTTQSGLYILRVIDEYVAGFPIMVTGIFMCISIGWFYGVKQFSANIKHMIGHHTGYWWHALWCVITPLIILFILVFSAVGYEPLSAKYSIDIYPVWTEVVGFIILAIPVITIPIFLIYKLCRGQGLLSQRFHVACQSEANWGPALERHWKNVEYFPAVNTNTLAVDIDHSPLHTVSDHVHFTTVGVRVPSLSQTSLIPKPPLSPKKPRDMRERAILNHAYTNPQFHQSTASIDKSTFTPDDVFLDTDYFIVKKPLTITVETKDACTQTDQVIKSPKQTDKNKTLTFPPTIQKSSEDINGLIETNENKGNGPAVLHVNVTHF